MPEKLSRKLSRIFPFDVARLHGVPEQHAGSLIDIHNIKDYTGDYRIDNDISCLIDFNDQAQGVDATTFKAPSKIALEKISNQIGQHMLAGAHHGGPVRIGIIGIERIGKSIIVPSLFGSNMRLYQTLTNQFSNKTDDYSMGVIRGTGRDFGECAFIDGCESLPDENPRVISDNLKYGESGKSFKQVDAMNNADMLVVSHPNEMGIVGGRVAHEHIRDEKGYDVMMFLYQLKTSEERHLTVVVPKAGRLNEGFEALRNTMNRQHAPWVKPNSAPSPKQ